ncbi:hypothetical protein C5Y96_22845 [Blastopirellula marina]|uniref:Uncharacterized protein n=1 Tax=Blastopirellula marina TaxID=124 RepID=A0A2S8F0G2_9BACT|nr:MULTISPECIES: hypothetical protein [Pirellulaceae]PQO25662.1 hypothetical protein C5Y96_22845 [Blastopirellula marina]RCS43345.1 hypothetical protein DTL36_22895 [Bremerella cremea]
MINLRNHGPALVFACCLFLVAFSDHVAADEPAAKLTDEEKLALIIAGKDELPRGERIKDFASEGEIDAVGRLVTIGKTVYFKTADQSFIPEGKRFPYPELFLELHLSENHAYAPLVQQNITRRGRALYDGPLRIQGNWAYEGAYHFFGVVWVDAASKVTTSPETDWSPWLKKRNARAKSTKPSSQ